MKEKSCCAKTCHSSSHSLDGFLVSPLDSSCTVRVMQTPINASLAGNCEVAKDIVGLLSFMPELFSSGVVAGDCGEDEATEEEEGEGPDEIDIGVVDVDNEDTLSSSARNDKVRPEREAPAER